MLENLILILKLVYLVESVWQIYCRVRAKRRANEEESKVQNPGILSSDRTPQCVSTPNRRTV